MNGALTGVETDKSDGEAGASAPGRGPAERPTNPDDRALLEFIYTRDVECPACGYNLRGLRTAVCPECSGRLYLSVGSENLALGPWAMALVSFALGAGFDGVVSVVISIGLIFFPPSGAGVRQAGLLLLSFVIGAAACGIGIWWLVTRRKSVWGRMARRRQWLIAWLIFAAVAGAHAAFGLYLTGHL